MTPKERVLTIINHEEPDRLAKHSGFTPEVSKSLRSIYKRKKTQGQRIFNPVLCLERSEGNGYKNEECKY